MKPPDTFHILEYSTEVPPPECEFGYTVPQLRDMLGDRFDEFDKWMYGQTCAVCEGRAYGHETKEYRESCGGVAHGIVYYPWDVKRFLNGRSVID